MRDAEVIVVGAGMSGLVAARELHARGIDVLVLEAADRTGGRAMSATTTLGSRVDLGGQWLGHDHHRLTALATELGATTFRMHSGTLPGIIDGTRRVSLAAPAMLCTVLALAGLGALSRIGTAPRFNAITLDALLRRVPNATARRLLDVITAISWTADADRISVHYATEMIGSQGGLRTMLSTTNGAQDSLLVEGIGMLTDRMAADLDGRVRTGHRVTAITRDEDGVTVQSSSGPLRAAKAIVTVAPPAPSPITHDPPLPADRVALQQNTFMGSVYKAIAIYERPFWRDRRGGEFLVLGDPGSAVFDTTAPGGPGHLCVLVGGRAAHTLDGLDAAARRRALLGPLVPHIGAEVLDPVDWHEKSWHRDEYVGGGYLALPIPGTTDGFLPMPSAPVGPIHWAGTETATEHPGYLEGAIESGERAAREVAEALRRDS
ncbi:flavin monoamine oxidase family protein [Mycolicibacterium frederiksbergense]|uniref:flavin monoamine oxidase family protein n=1 Tax=Mycolicibacterium frederiksbergense TaxID=117567 RepID=UPI00265C67F8|nr:FAD-dependent oxidoreductase [Mycolicibacterium frederiksbergense]MDO0972790.1 FAD-dependent oxidoreductase [Mycolicibacterium frederiksbergense]